MEEASVGKETGKEETCLTQGNANLMGCITRGADLIHALPSGTCKHLIKEARPSRANGRGGLDSLMGQKLSCRILMAAQKPFLIAKGYVIKAWGGLHRRGWKVYRW